MCVSMLALSVNVSLQISLFNESCNSDKVIVMEQSNSSVCVCVCLYVHAYVCTYICP